MPEDMRRQQIRERNWRCQGYVTMTSHDGRASALHVCQLQRHHWGQCVCWCDSRFSPAESQPKQHVMWPDWLLEAAGRHGPG